MSTENDNTYYQVTFTGAYDTVEAVLRPFDGWTDSSLLQVAEALAGVTLPSGCSIQVQKMDDVLTTYNADTTVSPAVFD